MLIEPARRRRNSRRSKARDPNSTGHLRSSCVRSNDHLAAIPASNTIGGQFWLFGRPHCHELGSNLKQIWPWLPHGLLQIRSTQHLAAFGVR